MKCSTPRVMQDFLKKLWISIPAWPGSTTHGSPRQKPRGPVFEHQTLHSFLLSANFLSICSARIAPDVWKLTVNNWAKATKIWFRIHFCRVTFCLLDWAFPSRFDDFFLPHVWSTFVYFLICDRHSTFFVMHLSYFKSHVPSVGVKIFFQSLPRTFPRLLALRLCFIHRHVFMLCMSFELQEIWQKHEAAPSRSSLFLLRQKKKYK